MEELFPLLTARGLGFETSVLEPCVLVLRGSQQKYHGIIGVAVDDIAGGGDDVWEQAISQLKQRFTFGHLRSGKRETSVAERSMQAADGPMHAWTACLHQESGLCAPSENEEGTIGRCKRD